MAQELTKQDILDLLARQAAEFDRRLEQSRKEAEQSRKEAEASREASRKDFDKRMKRLSREIGSLSHTWGRFAEEQVRPQAIEMFQARGIEVHYKAEHVTFELTGKKYVEVDLLLENEETVVVIEIKNTLEQKDIERHLERMDKLIAQPIKKLQGKHI
ncbi:MAG: DUF3782 domain-containing protein [Okeania sp. SIO3C4]|nr:DUF3782 domain-containing protein [Okeania sp. SIO3C4]